MRQAGGQRQDTIFGNCITSMEAVSGRNSLKEVEEPWNHFARPIDQIQHEDVARAWWQMADELADIPLPWEFDVAAQVDVIDSAWWEFLGRRTTSISDTKIQTGFRQYTLAITGEKLRNGYTTYTIAVQVPTNRELIAGKVLTRTLAGNHSRLVAKSTPDHREDWQHYVLYHLIKTFLIWLAFDQGIHIAQSSKANFES